MIDAMFNAKVDAFLKENERNIIEDIRTLVGVPSVEGPAEKDAPFGPGPKKALETGLKIAEQLGLATHNCENYLGYAELKGKEDKHIASITHVDVVPEGNGWTGDPFIMREREGYLLGRGVGDDKGPSIIALYMAKFFKEQGSLRYGLRILLGTNEETGMEDVKYYLSHYEPAAFTFSPDGAFPVCNGEKGVYQGQLHSAKIEGGNVMEFTGGVASNVIPDRAYAILKADAAALPAAEGITVTTEGAGLARIAAKGKGGHAASPKGTVNAIGLIVFYLAENGLLAESEKPYFELLKKLFCCTDGAGLGVASDDGLFDPLTCIGGMIKLEEGVFTEDFNIRFPTSTTGAEIDSIIQPQVEAVGGFLTHGMVDAPFYIDPKTPAIQCLVDTYNEVTGRHETPFVMGGGTYARHFPNAVSYGIELPGIPEGQPDFVGTAHGADEGVSVATLLEALKIYILAVARLNELDL